MSDRRKAKEGSAVLAPASWLLRSLRQTLRREWLLAALVLVFPAVLWLNPARPAALAALVDWKTIAALAGLMMLSRGLEFSGALDRFARAILHRARHERNLATALVALAALLAAVVTNDVALFITVPLTLVLARGITLPVGRLVVFQALAVNAGSTLSPVGNPQNLFLWQASGTGFGAFLLAMLPLAAAMLALLFALVRLGFRAQPLALPQSRPSPLNTRLIWLCLPAYPLFLIAVNAGQAEAAAAVVLALFAALHRRILRGVDWPLLAVFVLMFVNLGLLSGLPAVATAVRYGLELPGGLYMLGALVSQGMSNVPATIFLHPFGTDWRALAWGANVGGFGLAIGSLANLIALRLAPVPGIWAEFHLWSVPVFFGALLLGAVLF